MKTVACFLAVSFFLSCQSKTPKLKFNRLVFEAEACYGECPIFAMTIEANGSAVYYAQAFNKKTGRFKTLINKNILDSLFILLNNADLLNLNDNYSTNSTDHATYTMIAIMENGGIKKIEDYGPSGPVKLKKIYEYFFSLRDSQDWK